MNGRVHSATGMRPREVNGSNALSVFRRLYPHLADNQQPLTGRVPEFAIGDPVRILFPGSVFTKGFDTKTSPEVYKVARILFHPTIRYKLSNINSDQIVAGSFVSNELIPVTLPQQK